MIRLFLDQPLSGGARLEPSPDQARYLTGVMRQGVGDEVLMFNGRDGEWRARLAEVSKRGCVLEAVEQTRKQAGTPDLELVVALVKRARLETIVEKAAELGCRRVRLAITRRTQADHTRVDRLQTIAIEASEQTGRLDVPDIVAPEKLDRILDAWPEGRRLMFCDEGGDVRPALEALPREAAAWSVLIGPEGGFAPEERERLRGLDFVTPVGLGPRILRADTAAISALTLWQAALGDWAP
ncbi:16S rRNA (uracil(1498)-N(3))-methyltransferase [Brevundimonas sp.]|uniref:16S rRNA (uracil(1498)-N(3))-methyltransferase n=1 Tax=Brevundimonas sp. TaxID=1871086 RepID=UPI0025EA53EC|nr:16S rRNA (uracil(1498)-N(3))-methyltransferase [Brevundimonas sp.]